MKTIIECGGGAVISEDQALGRVQVPADRRKPFYVVRDVVLLLFVRSQLSS